MNKQTQHGTPVRAVSGTGILPVSDTAILAVSSRHGRDAHATDKRPARAGFTIVELIVVIAIFAIVVATVVPSVGTFMDQMTAQQAYETMVAQIGAAQAAAPARGTYTAVHVQRADGAKNARDILGVDENTSFVSIFQLNEVSAASPNTPWNDTSGKTSNEVTGAGNKWMRFQLASGYETRRIPGGMAFGQIDDTYVDDNTDKDGDGKDHDYLNINNATRLNDFTTFSIVFDPNGTLVRTVENGRNPRFDANSDMWFHAGTENTNTDDGLWEYNANNYPGELGVRAFTMFDYPELSGTAANDRDNYLDRVGQFLPVMSYTGEVFRRE